MSTLDSVAALILAAGSSSRMSHGHHKLLLPLGERPVLSHVVEAALQSQATPVLVVLGHQSVQVSAAISRYMNHNKLHVQENPDYRSGMSTSLRTGIQTLTRYPDCLAVLVLLGDQPFVSAQLIDRLLAARQQSGKRIIAPCYHGKRGNPVLFDASLFSELATVSGDEGGRSVIARHADEVEQVELSDAVAQHDVDTWEAYQMALTIWQNQKIT
ncbi:nucleotidyltransferase family protein [Dictyobacter aurantiacus]|uniref:MobA-like NTP transferase domain-containing protein n=1 Tax=Dictyobacter aurantiacus TaxID=1936993 RepID=A0A401Z932_9CHLR|nr:nucleotidyltransferase family protein [Dictyobacter aurantiacus]GCE03306.1 hypothetical protein KDAU_06350 [Dictyobacter aurantiacus]